MTTTFNYTIPHILISPKYRIYRHLLLWLTVFFITANILWEPSEKKHRVFDTLHRLATLLYCHSYYHLYKYIYISSATAFEK